MNNSPDYPRGEEFFEGKAQFLIALSEQDEAVARQVGGDVSDALVAHASGHALPSSADEVLWSRDQRLLLQLAHVPGVDRHALAAAILEAMTIQAARAVDPLDPAVTEFVVSEVPNEIKRLLRERPVWLESGSGLVVYDWLELALMALRGEVGLVWCLELLTADRWALDGYVASMMIGETSPWSPEDWTARLHGICNSDVARPGFLDQVQPGSKGQPPAEACAAFCRAACWFADGADDPLVHRASNLVAQHANGDPTHDATLVWWDAVQVAPNELRGLIEGLEPSHARAMVDGARAEGLLNEFGAERLCRCEVDGTKRDHGWEVVGVTQANAVETDRDVGCGSPWATFPQPTLTVEVAAGRYAVKLIKARHRKLGTQFAGAEIRLAMGHAVGWRELRSGLPGFRGYPAEAGVGSFGDPQAFASVIDDLPNDLVGGQAAHTVLFTTRQGAGRIVAFTVGPQDQDCRTWVGVNASGCPVRIFCDLGLLGLTPTDAAPILD